MAAAQPNRRHFKERRDCLNEYNDRELLERFRLDAAGIRYIESLVRDDVVSGSNRNCALTPMQKVLITLRFWQLGKCSYAMVMTWESHSRLYLGLSQLL